MVEPLDYAEPKKSGSRPLLARVGFSLACLFVSIVEGGRLMRAVGQTGMSYAWDNWWDVKLLPVLAGGFAVSLLAISQPETRTVLSWLSLAVFVAYTCTCVGNQVVHPTFP